MTEAARGLRLIEDAECKALDRVVETAKRMEQHEEVDRWQFADDVLEAVDELAESQNGFETRGMGPAAPGLYAAIDTVNDRLRSAKIASVGRQSLVAAYSTAKAWPEESRVDGANYWAHYELRARQFDGRRQRVLARLVRESDQPVGTPQVRLWKSAQKHEQVVSFLEQIERGVRGFLKRKGSPWDRVVYEDRQAIAKVLRSIADEVSAGEFGR